MTILMLLLALVVAILAVTWPANSRRWGDDEVPRAARPPDPVWEPWAYMQPEAPAPVALPARTGRPNLYVVGEPEALPGSPPPEIGDGR